jgi:nicotinate-nucleotide adenylyltransferase
MQPKFLNSTVLFGGSFDPIHLGHLHVATECLASFPVGTELYFVPTGISPGKKSVASGKDRQHFLEISLKDTPFKLWDFELMKSGQSFTVETLREAHRLGASKANLFWLMGADSYTHFSAWQESTEIRRLAQLVVAGRPGQELTRQHDEDILLKIPQHPASSSAVREACARGEIPFEALPEPLFVYLRHLTLQSKNPYAIPKAK